MKIISNESDYLTARNMLTVNNLAVEDYCKQNKTNSILVKIADTFPFANEVTNELRSAIEVYEFTQNKPKNYFCYVNVNDKIITTWTGQKLGTITYFGHIFKSNFGDKRQYLTIKAINGLIYGGYYFKSSGDYAIIKALKNAK